MKKSAAVVTKVFVDEIEDEVVRVLIQGRTFHLARSAFPAGATEGDWLEIRISPTRAPAQSKSTDAKRRRLSKDDDGGDFSL